MFVKTIRDTLAGCQHPLSPITTDTFFMSFSQIAAIDETELKDIIQIYPNPAKDYLLLDFGDIKEEKSIQIFDLQGREVKDEKKVIDTKTQINVSTLPKGVYLLDIKSSKGVVRRRFEVMK